MRTIGDNIKTRLKAAGRTQASLSRETKIEAPLIWRYVEKERAPGVRNLWRIAKALNCTMEDLCEEVFE